MHFYSFQKAYFCTNNCQSFGPIILLKRANSARTFVRTNGKLFTPDMDTMSVRESQQAQNINSAIVGTQQLSAGDLEALANIQEELDMLAQAPTSASNPSDAQDEEQGVVGIQEGVTGTSVWLLFPKSNCNLS